MTTLFGKKGKLSDYVVATEVISFQNDNFGDKIAAIISDIYKIVDNNRGMPYKKLREIVIENKLIELLEKVIFDRLGIRLKINIKTSSPGAIMPMFFNEHHILLQKIFHGKIEQELPDQKQLIEKSLNKKGHVDLEKARVSGIFSEYMHDCWMDFVGNYLKYKLTPAEQTVILLHELGHAFTYYEFSDRLETTNQVMKNLSDLVRDKNINLQKRTYVVRELEAAMAVKENSLQNLVDEQNQTIFGLKLFKHYFDFVKSQMPVAKYDETASEQLADNFAARFGYGRHLISGLDKLYVAGASIEKSAFLNSTIGSWLRFIIDIASQGLIIISFSGGIPVLVVFYFLICMFFLKLVGRGGTHMTYDDLKIRYTRVRQQIIEQIKSEDIDKDVLRRLILDINFVDDIINNTYLDNSITVKLSNLIFSSNRSAESTIQQQYLIEELAHNDLFLLSAKLKTI